MVSIDILCPRSKETIDKTIDCAVTAISKVKTDKFSIIDESESTYNMTGIYF